MRQLYSLTPGVWPALLTAVCMVALCAYGWRRRGAPGAAPFAFASLMGAGWAVGVAMQQAAVDAPTQALWIRLQSVWHLPTVTATLCFVLDYVWPGRWVNRRNVALLSLVPLLGAGLIVTQEQHGLVWRGFEATGAAVDPVRAPIGWALVLYAYALGLISVASASWLFWRSPEHRWPMAIIVAGQVGVRVVYLYDWHLHVVVLGIALVMYSVALFGFRVFDPIPLARRTALTQMQEGMLVLDPQGRIASLNPAAQAILGMPAQRILGRPIRDLLPAGVDTREGGSASGAARAEVSVGTGTDARHYGLAVSALRDWRGAALGHLLLLHDITERRRVQAQAIEQQRLTAAVQERERLARELHDSLSQSLAFVNLQAQAAELFLQSGQTNEARASLARLAQIGRDLQGDMRELIGHLLSDHSPSEGLCGSLRRLVARFEQQTGLAVALEIAGDAEALCGTAAVAPAATTEVLRIAQEALANVHKHAGRPDHIHVGLATEGEEMRLTIADGGAGFDPALARQTDNHYGLRVMGQRAESIDARLDVHSAPGRGTRVELRLPLRRIGIDGDGRENV